MSRKQQGVITFLCDADGTATHAHSQSIHARIDQILCLSGCDHWTKNGTVYHHRVYSNWCIKEVKTLTVSSNHLQVCVFLFNIIYHADLKHRVALWRVLEAENTRWTSASRLRATQSERHPHTHQYDHIHSSLHQQIQPVLVVVPGANGSPAQELFAWVFGGQRVVSVLLQIRPGNDGHQLIVIVDNGKFSWWKSTSNVETIDRKESTWAETAVLWGILCTFLTALQNIIGFFQRNTSRSHYQVFPFCHRLGDGKHVKMPKYHSVQDNFTCAPPLEVCCGPSQTGSRCLWKWRCPPVCCPFCLSLWLGSQRSRVSFWLQPHPRLCGADSSQLGLWWSPARTSENREEQRLIFDFSSINKREAKKVF